MRAGCLAFLVVLTCTMTSPAASQFFSRKRASDTIPAYDDSVDQTAAEFGLAPLRRMPSFAAGHREVRVWMGFGMAAPEEFVRIEQRGARVTGMFAFHWRRRLTAADSASDLEAEDDPGRISDRELWESLRESVGCGPRQQTRTLEYCLAEPAPTQSWAGLLRALDRLGAADLPDESWLDQPTPLGYDGWSIVVEVRDARRYRTYSYWCPSATSPHAAVRAAAAIADSVGRLVLRRVP